ncbi:ABC transporter permease [Nocardia sp. alder85J]|uniref:ABC transporter permease n=1 Tax=Nocardia sp. alder85J TaxID=2862949 RepID=UPI001CD6CF02|nr:ABC transporter permease [Nocardia sp. alder85J]MCX4094165.1 ABC transporter permease [Nocardia sp. alder85J]
MIAVALASLRTRWGACTAAFLSVFLGTGIVTAFAAMLDTAAGNAVPKDSRTTLIIVASVVGGWGAVIVAASVAAALAVTTRQRAAELALLRSIGATPRQVVTLIMRENQVVVALAVLCALPAGYGGGFALLALLRHTHQVSAAVGYRFGPAAIGIGVGIALVASMTATRLTAARAAKHTVRDALFTATADTRRTGRVQTIAGLIVLGLGLQCAVLTVFVLDAGDVNTLQSVAAEGCILAGIGFALLGPHLLGAATTLLAPATRVLGGRSGEIALAAIRQRLRRAAIPMMPVVVATSVATGTLYMQLITNSVHPDMNSDDRNVETLNYVMVGVISLFAAVMLVDLIVVALTERRREFAQQRLLGATPRQLLGVVGVESALTLVVGLLFGTLGAAVTVVPFGIRTTHRLLPSVSIACYLGVIAVVATLTFATAVLVTRRHTRLDPIAVLHAPAV